MEKITILYIDDSPESGLERFLESYRSGEYEIEYNYLIFDPLKGYESLIKSSKVKSANIIVIDSRLFENSNAVAGKFTGEEFKVILKKYLPFIEVIVVSQNETEENLETIAKHDPRSDLSAEEYYKRKLSKCIEQAIRNIREFRSIINVIEHNSSWEKTLREKVSNSMQGIDTYDELTKGDIDQLINTFKEMQEKING